MKTKEEILAVIEKGVNEDLDIDICAIRKSDGYKGSVCYVLGNTDTIESYFKEFEKAIIKLVEFSKWEIVGFEYEIE